MATIFCPHRGVDCDCSESPFLNLSAEAPDPPLFLSVRDGSGEDTTQNGWWKPACQKWFFSDISELDAQLNAEAAAQECLPQPPTDPPPCDPSVMVCPPGPGGCPDCPPDPGGQTVMMPSEQQICSVECPDGGIESYYTLPLGYVQSPWSYFHANTLAEALCSKLAAENPLCFDRDIDPACNNAAYSYQLLATGGTPPYTFEYGAGIPGGFVTTDSGLITGFASVAGLFAFNVLVTDSGVPPRTASGSVTLRIIEITTPSPLPTPAIGVPYSVTLAQTGAIPPLSWTIVSGALAAGLTLDETTGVISGTPTANQIGDIEVLLQDNAT